MALIPVLLTAAIRVGSAPAVVAGGCAAPRATAAYAAKVTRALASGHDLWGDALLKSPGGPTFLGASGHLAPILYARSAKGRPLTRSGVYYLPFSEPEGSLGAGTVALHVADGSEIISNRVGGPALEVGVAGGPYGSCVSRLAPARLASGWLPILDTRYEGYSQESFAARIPETGSLVSFVRVSGPGPIRLTPTVRGLHRSGDSLVRGSRTYLVFGAGAHWTGGSLVFSGQNAYAAWIVHPGHVKPFVLDATRYAAARASIGAFWRSQLAEGATFDVPETRVMDAERALLVQNLELSWRYSIGNPYEEFSFPESIDGAQVMTELGFAQVGRSILRVSLTRRATPYPGWTMGEKLLGAAVYERLTGDTGFLGFADSKLAAYVAALGRRQQAGGLLQPEHFSSDITDAVRGLHAQAVAWQGLTSMAAVWKSAGHPKQAARATAIAARLSAGLRLAVERSERRLPDGSLFLPMRLDAGEQPYASVTESRAGSYWNLVAPYALASGLFPPGGAQAKGALAYLLLHGSRLLGLVRAGGYALYGPGATTTLSGTDQVYGVNAARFMAAMGEPDQLVLSLYGQLADGMTQNTFVAGEAASVAPLDGLRYRAMYLPPNSVSNDAFLETLRLMLVQEAAGGLRLAFATPRGWLSPGKRIAVAGAPTGFGPLSYTLQASAHEVRVHLDPLSKRPGSIELRLRLPAGRRIRSVSPRARFDSSSGTIDLPVTRAPLDLTVQTT
ncbi:MAG TPA: hypothetical protein VH063_18415 [Gaiellaceae bacterium]|nr:hypothetical protein [Gaiellaceae bacterium]